MLSQHHKSIIHKCNKTLNIQIIKILILYLQMFIFIISYMYLLIHLFTHLCIYTHVYISFIHIKTCSEGGLKSLIGSDVTLEAVLTKRYIDLSKTIGTDTNVLSVASNGHKPRDHPSKCRSAVRSFGHHTSS